MPFDLFYKNVYKLKLSLWKIFIKMYIRVFTYDKAFLSIYLKNIVLYTFFLIFINIANNYKFFKKKYPF